VSADETIRIGLIGCGGRGRGAADQAMNTAGPTKLVAVADAFEDNLNSAVNTLSRQHGEKVDVPEDRRFVGFDAFQKVLEQDVDLVILATPPGFRPLHFEAAVNAGKHVFMEKPVAVDPAGVRKVVDAAAAAKKKNLAVAVGLQRRHEPIYIETIKRTAGRGDWPDCGNASVLERRGCLGASSQGGSVGDGVSDAKLVLLQLAVRRPYYRAAHSQSGCDQLADGWLSDDGRRGRVVVRCEQGKEYGEIYDHHFVEFTYENDGDRSVLLSQCRHIGNCWNSVSEYASRGHWFLQHW
jgi:hypothetical protein